MMNQTEIQNNSNENEYNISEILSISWNIFTKNYTHFFTIIFILFFPTYILIEYLLPYTDIIDFGTAPTQNMLYALLLESFAGMMASIAITFSVFDAYLGNPLDAKSSFDRMFKRIIFVLLTMIMAALLIFAGAVLLIIPGIMAAVFLTFALQAATLKNVWSADALKYSYYLIKPRFGKIFGYVLLFGLMNLIATSIFLGILDYLGENEIIAAVFKTVASLITAYFNIVFAVFFLNADDTKDFEFVD